MLSPQNSVTRLCSSKGKQSDEKVLLQTYSSCTSMFKSNKFEREQPQTVDSQNKQYSKLLKQKDLKILSLSQRLKISEGELQKLKQKSRSLQYDLNFFKSKIQQQFYRNICLQSQIEIINTELKAVILRIVEILQKSDTSMQSFANYLSNNQHSSADQNHIQISKKLIQGLEFQISEISSSFYMLKKDPDNQKTLVKSADLRMQEYCKADEMEKQALRKHINGLIDFYETKMIDSQDYKRQMQNLRRQREFTRQLLISCQKEKNTFLNDICEVAKREYQIDFEMMNKAELIKLSIKLLSRISDLEKDKLDIQNKAKSLQCGQKAKYENMLKTVKQMQKNYSPKPPTLKRLGSLPLC